LFATFLFRKSLTRGAIQERKVRRAIRTRTTTSNQHHWLTINRSQTRSLQDCAKRAASGELDYQRPPAFAFRLGPNLLIQLVRPLRQSIGQVDGDFGDLIFLHSVLTDQLREVATIDASRDIVSRRNRKKRSRVVVEATVL